MKYIRLIKANDKYNYMLLDRLKKDCEYFLRYPNTKHLWAGDIKQQIDKMLELYDSLDPKPEWITKEDINNYYKQMLEVSDSKQIKAFDLHSIIKKIRDTLGDIADSSTASDAEWFDQGEYAYIYIPTNQMNFTKNVTTGEIDEEALEEIEELNGKKVEVIKINKTSKGFETGGIITGKPEFVDVRFENGYILKDVPTTWLKHEPFGEKEASNYLMEAIKMIKDRYKELSDIGSWSDAEWFEKGEYAYIYIPVNKFDFRKNITTGETDKEAVEALEELNGQKVEILKIKATIKGPYDIMTADAKPTRVDVRFEDGQVWEDVNTEWLKHKPFGEDEAKSNYLTEAIKASKEFFVEYRYPARTEDAWYITIDKIEANTEEEALQIAKEKLVGADNFRIVNKSFLNSDLYTKDSKPKYFHRDWYYDGEKLRNEYSDDEERKVESKRNLSKILNPEDFDKIEKEIQSLNMAKKRIEDSIKSYEKSNNKGSEYKRSILQLKRIDNELKSKLEQESLMWDELTLK